MSNQEQQPYLIWDTYEILNNQAKFLIENGDAVNDDEALSKASDDHDLFSFEWDDLLECLSDKLQEINSTGYWYCEVNNFGWRNQSGWSRFEADNAKVFLSNILPNTECTFRIFIDDDNTIRIQNFHHDSPTGNEWYTVTIDKEALDEVA